MLMKIGDKVQVVDKPISLLKKHAGIKGEIIKKGFGYEWLVKLDGEWLVKLDGELWWAKGYDLVVIVDD